MQYRVLKMFWYPTAPGIMQRVKDGESPPMKERAMMRADVGTVLELEPDIVESLAGISDGPYVEEVTDGKKKPR